MKRMWAVIREALASAKARPVDSIITVIIIAGMCATVLLTTGRTVGAEQAVLGSIDSAGTRSIVIRADPDAGLTTGVLARLANIDGIEWAGAFGAARDVTNVAVPSGAKVPVRLVWGDDLTTLGIPSVSAVTDSTGWASKTALEQLGMVDRIGGVIAESGADYAIAGPFPVPDYLTFLEPLVVVPQTEKFDNPGVVTVLVVIASRPDLVAPISQAVQSVLAVDDPTKVSLSTSESFASLRALVQGQLGSFGRNLIIVIFALTALLVAAILYGLVMLRRKDFGRRRALGASQSLIVVLLLTQMVTLSLVGSSLGVIAATIGLQLAGDPLPSLDFIAAIGLLAIAVGTIAALLPALAAARRDPLRELRVP